MDRPQILKAKAMNKCIGCFTCMLMCAAVNHKSHSINQSAIKIKTKGGMQGSFYAVVCLGCDEERACVETCKAGALTERPGGGTLLNKDKCVSCGACAKACVAGAVFFDQEKHPLICKHCGLCVGYCPHRCITMEELVKEEVQK